MCGIAGVVSANKSMYEVAKMLLEALVALKYRGTDSFGICIANSPKNILVSKVVESTNPMEMEKSIKEEDWMTSGAVCGLGHGRWATKGSPKLCNAQPLFDAKKKIFGALNGNINNYEEIKQEIGEYAYTSETDTEVGIALVSVLAERNPKLDLLEIFALAVRKCEGDFAFVIGSVDRPGELVAYMSSNMSLIGGIKRKDGAVTECYIVSDEEVFRTLEADELVRCESKTFLRLTTKGIETFTADYKSDITVIMMSIENTVDVYKRKASSSSKGHNSCERGYFMTKEIDEQKERIQEIINKYVNFNKEKIITEEIETIIEAAVSARRIVFVGMGTSYHSCLSIEGFANDVLEKSVLVKEATRFLDDKTYVDNNDVVFFVTQSGETACVVKAAEYAERRGAFCVAVTNRLNSGIVKKCKDRKLDIMAGGEFGVASTKAYTCQSLVLSLVILGVYQTKNRGDSRGVLKQVLESLRVLPDLVKRALELDVMAFVDEFVSSNSPLMVVSGRGDTATPHEAALKFKEICYLPTHSVMCGDLDHGPLALITKGTRVLVVATQDSKNDDLFKKTKNQIDQIVGRGGHISMICTANFNDDRSKTTLIIPMALHYVHQPIISIIPLHRIALLTSLSLEINPDVPRNLAKSVTVE